jgi:hypothetical protein
MRPEELLAAAARFPEYLTTIDKQRLQEELRQYQARSDYYWALPPNDLLQGDGYLGLTYTETVTLEQRKVRGLLITNSCDMSSANSPSPDTRVLFAPIASMQRLAEVYVSYGWSSDKVQSTLDAIKKQLVSHFFYLPASGSLAESVAVFDDLQSQPLAYFGTSNGGREFSLNQFGWYMLLIKLSVHFTRMGERLTRS